MKKRRFGRLAALVMVLACLAMLLCGASFDIPSDSWVMDEANILSAQTEQYVNERTKVLSDACGAQIGVATVEYTGSLSVEDYAYQLANEWGLGDAKKNNGVLLLLVPGEDDYRCIQGSGLERTLPTSTLSTILRSDMEPNWVKGDYDTGVQQTVQALYEELASIYNVNTSAGTAGGSQQQSRPTNNSSGGSGVSFLLVLIILVVIVVAVLLTPRGPRGPRASRRWRRQRLLGRDVPGQHDGRPQTARLLRTAPAPSAARRWLWRPRELRRRRFWRRLRWWIRRRPWRKLWRRWFWRPRRQLRRWRRRRVPRRRSRTLRHAQPIPTAKLKKGCRRFVCIPFCVTLRKNGVMEAARQAFPRARALNSQPQ